MATIEVPYSKGWQSGVISATDLDPNAAAPAEARIFRMRDKNRLLLGLLAPGTVTAWAFQLWALVGEPGSEFWTKAEGGRKPASGSFVASDSWSQTLYGKKVHGYFPQCIAYAGAGNIQFAGITYRDDRDVTS